MKKVLLISMPYGSLSRPALGISLLKAHLKKAGYDCTVRYLTNSFAQFIGYDEYEWVSARLPYIAFAGDWTFSQALYATPLDNGYIEQVLQKTWAFDDTSIQRLLRIQALVPHFLQYCLASVPWDEYSIVGFTSTFEQNIASLALAKQLKEKHPQISVVFGGANWEGSMGLALHEQFPFVDYVCSGEADESFPALVDYVLNPSPTHTSPETIKGLIHRQQGQSCYTGSAPMVRQLDALPTPDFTDYFNELYRHSWGNDFIPVLLMETSRGCWWGEKAHCTFCGLNGGAMAFRSKSAQRALDELFQLVDQWQIPFIEIVDNILDMRYFKEFLPALASAGRGLSIYYEVKANLTRKHVALLLAAGVHRIQPGIESMNDHVLKLMNKGTTALRNIQFLKWCLEYNVGADWNLLYGFPGETQEDYDEMLVLLQSIRFLPPPTACGPVRMDRFSPYFMQPDTYDLTNIRPIVSYAYLYPFSKENLHNIAYYFDFDYSSGRQASTYAARVIDFAQEWQRRPEEGSLRAQYGSEHELLLIDTRSYTRQGTFSLVGLERIIYEYCDEVRTLASIKQYLSKEYDEPTISSEQLLPFLNSLISNELLITDGEFYLSLSLGLQQPIPLVVSKPAYTE